MEQKTFTALLKWCNFYYSRFVCTSTKQWIMELNDTVRSETPNSLWMTDFSSNARLLYQVVFRKTMTVELHIVHDVLYMMYCTRCIVHDILYIMYCTWCIVHDVFCYTLSKLCKQHSDFRMKKLHKKFKPIQQFVRIADWIIICNIWSIHGE